MTETLEEPIRATTQSADFFRKITIEELNDLGFELTGRQMPVGSRPYKYGLLEIHQENDKEPAGFCYLYSLTSQTGIIRPDTFNHYLTAELF